MRLPRLPSALADALGSRRPAALAAVAVLALAIVARLHNAWAAPVLAGYDSFGHFTYAWYVAATGRFPLPTNGWSFFHPPLWYSLVAALWNALDGVDPVQRLKIAKVLVAAGGVLHAWAAWQVVSRRFPGNLRLAFLASAMMLLIPVELYSAGFLGNEGLHAILGTCSVLALLAVLRTPGLARAALLGLVLGLAMLAKFSAVAVVAAALAAMALQALVRRDFLGGTARVLVAAAVMLAVCGPWYARNLAAYGTPFQLSRDTFMVAYVEGNQPQAARGWADYLTFDPLIFRRPSWPRGSTPLSDPGEHGFERAVRESVWTGLYANAWFDGFGGWVLPPVVESEGSRRAGQALLTLGILPTLLMLFGACRAVAALRRRGWEDETVAFALISLAMGVLFVYGTRQAPIAAAVKATYFTPISVVFAYWFACGAERFEQGHPRRRLLVDAVCGAAGLIGLAVFWQGLLFETDALGRTMPNFSEAKAVQLGVVEYAGGNREGARKAFEQAAASNYHLAWENLGFLALDDGRPREALRLLRLAADLQREQLDGGPIGRERFLALAEAEYSHSIGVALHALGRRGRAEAAWTRAVMQDPGHAEALWCLAMTSLEDVLSGSTDEAARRGALAEAARRLANVRMLDPGFAPGWTLGAVVEGLRGDCDYAQRLADGWRERPWWRQRNFPAETGTGAGFSASIGRRRLVRAVRPELSLDGLAARCGVRFN